MRNFIIAAALLAAAPALADSDRFSGFATSGAVSASGFVNNPEQSGSWSVGAMNESYGFAGIRETKGGVELSTSGGSTSEGFGQNFRGLTAAGGVGFGSGRFGFRGRF